MDNQAQAAGFDIDALEDIAEITHRCGVIFDEAGEAISGFIMVGKNSQENRDAVKKIRIENLARSAARKKAVDTTTEAGAAVVIDAVERTNRAQAVAVVVGWFGFNKGGQPLAFDKTLLEKMFDRCPEWQAKVLTDLENEANFMPASSKA